MCGFIAMATCGAFGLSAVYAADQFVRLSAADIRAWIIGKVVTDDVHWADRFSADGTLTSLDMGARIPGAWKIEDDQLCLVMERERASTNCYEIWLSKTESGTGAMG